VKWTRMPGHLAAFIAEMDFGTAPAITDALRHMTDTALLGYLPGPVKEDMCQATSDYLRAHYAWDIPPAQIYPTADVLSAYDLVLEKFAREGSSVILPTPAYMPFLTMTPARGRDVIEVPMVPGPTGRWEMDLDGIARAFESGGHVLILCNPHNPLGRVYTRSELEALVTVVDSHDGFVPYASVSETAATHTITATSASKSWNIAGLKCAQLIVSSDSHQEALQTLGHMISHGTATPGVLANTAAYRSGEPWLTDVLEYIDISRTLLADLLAEHLPEVTYQMPEGTYIAWLDARGLPDVKGERSWAQFFSDEAQVVLTDGALCGDAGVGHLRLMLSTPHHILEKIVLAMSMALKAHST
jgi:cystathionine beta-lyase